MLKIQNKEVSPDLESERHERDALLGERNSLQEEMISLGETNKRVKNEIKESEGKIEELSKKQSSLMGSVYKLDELISHKKDEIVNLDKIYSDKKYALEKTLPNVKNVLADLEQKKLPIQNQIDRLLMFKKEAQESKYWLHMISIACPECKKDARMLWKETQEITLIFGKIISTLRG